MHEQAPELPQLITADWISRTIHAAALFDLARHVGDGARTADEVAAAAGTHPEATLRVLRALASIGMFAQDGDGRFSRLPLGEQLADPTMRALSLMTGGAAMHRAWGELHHSLRTGEPAFDHANGASVFGHLSGHPEDAAIFDAAMTGVHGPETEPMIDAFDFSGFDTVVDIGGGNGSVLAAILRRNPGVRGVLYDLPHVTERAASLFEREGLGDRCAVEGGDFFEAVPERPGATAYVLRHIVHDWTDAQAAHILRNCRQAMGDDPGSRVLVVETVIQPGNDPSPAKWLDLMMLVIGGKERTEAQYRELFAAGCLRLTRVVPTAAQVSVVEGVAG